jgi:predicted RecB family endonuclease
MGDRREAYNNIMLSMPRGTDPLAVQRAAREFAKVELADHKYVMVLHDHHANPHMHISVRAESRHRKRLSPRKAELHLWRETFAEKLRVQGIEAEATRQATRGRDPDYDTLWRLEPREDRRLRTTRLGSKATPAARAARAQTVEAWLHVGRRLRCQEAR